LLCAGAACLTAFDSTTKVLTNKCNESECINLFCLAEGTKNILDGKSDDARLCAALAMYIKITDDFSPDFQKLIELLEGDEHTLVQFFRKQIPCSCLDEKYKEVKSITKTGICSNGQCPLPDRRAIRSKMVYCTRCINGHDVSYCSRKCQEAHWPRHKKECCKNIQEIAALRLQTFASKCATRDDMQV
jgi:hypothetical protein